MAIGPCSDFTVYQLICKKFLCCAAAGRGRPKCRYRSPLLSNAL